MKIYVAIDRSNYVYLEPCRLGSNSRCRMVPRQVCTNSCSKSEQCNTCNAFVQRGPGFGSCPSSTCGNWYPGNDDADAFNTTFAGNWEAGIRALPAVGQPQGSMMAQAAAAGGFYGAGASQAGLVDGIVGDVTVGGQG